MDPPGGDYPCTGGKTWAISPQGKAHLTRDGYATHCGKMIGRSEAPWTLKRRDSFRPDEDGIEASTCGSCF